ncbi:MAG TPA: hypothetical protein VKU19_09900 [Bryobacteraceae bacterium]|nr:hypothetical protein [Bryobacteraceae bacterium]
MLKTPEWQDPNGSAMPIRYRDILRAGNKTDSEIGAVEAELESLASQAEPSSMAGCEHLFVVIPTLQGHPSPDAPAVPFRLQPLQRRSVSRSSF